MYLTGEFSGRNSIIQALRHLRASGMSPNDIDVFSDIPLEIPRSALYRRSHMSLAVVSGAILSCLFAIGFVYFTQHNYRIITGGMPIFSFWATGVVFYELTMLGAIVTALVWFLHESGLLRRRYRAAAPAFSPGAVCLRIQCPAEKEQAIRHLLQTAGASSVSVQGTAA